MFGPLRVFFSRWFSKSARQADVVSTATDQIQGQVVAFDENLLEQARSQWQLGQWESLVQLKRQTLQHHPARAQLALFAGAGHQMAGNQVLAREFFSLAQGWGCERQQIARMLTAETYASLGRAAAACGRQEQALAHFETAVSLGTPDADSRLLGQSRCIRETIRLGLLPQGGAALHEKLAGMKVRTEKGDHLLKIFETELELLRGELSVALQRQQLHRHGVTARLDAKGRPLEEWKEVLRRHSVSQLGQDLWVLEKTGYKDAGFFVEFGAGDGVLLSNSYLLEKEFRWQGICAEPNPKLFAALKQNRSCTVSNACIGGKTGDVVDFVYADVFGGIKQYIDSDSHKEKRGNYVDAGNLERLSTVSLHDFLVKHNAPRTIDYLSIDTEGSEYEILRNFPFDQWDVRFLTVEHNFTANRLAIRRMLEANGYACQEMDWDDWYFPDPHKKP